MKEHPVTWEQIGRLGKIALLLLFVIAGVWLVNRNGYASGYYDGRRFEQDFFSSVITTATTTIRLDL